MQIEIVLCIVGNEIRLFVDISQQQLKVRKKKGIQNTTMLPYE
jgi:hypothetical protein